MERIRKIKKIVDSLTLMSFYIFQK